MRDDIPVTKTNPGNFFEDVTLGQVIQHATPRTVTEGDRAVHGSLYPTLKKLAKEKKVSEDDEKRAMEEVQKMTDEEIRRMEELSRKKEADVMQI